jgi:hypothetical protein
VPAPPLLVSYLTHLYVAGRTDEGGLAKDFGCNRDNAIPISTVNSRFVGLSERFVLGPGAAFRRHKKK